MQQNKGFHLMYRFLPMLRTNATLSYSLTHRLHYCRYIAQQPAHYNKAQSDNVLAANVLMYV